MKHPGAKGAARVGRRLSPLFCYMLLIPTNAANAGDPIQGDHLADKATYLCLWRGAYPENPIPLPACDQADSKSKAISEMEAWWQWMFNTYTNKTTSFRDEFEADWLRDRKPTLDKEARIAREHVAAVRKEKEAAAQREESLRQAKWKAEHGAYVASFPSLSNESLCDVVHVGFPADSLLAARQELQRRHVIDPAEWPSISNHKITIGMSELALICAWGPASANRTARAPGYVSSTSSTTAPTSTWITAELPHGKIVGNQAR